LKPNLSLDSCSREHALPATLWLYDWVAVWSGITVSNAPSNEHACVRHVARSASGFRPCRTVAQDFREARSDTKSTTIIFGALDICRRATLLCAFMPGANMSMILMLLGAAILIGSAMISGLRFHDFLQHHAPGLAATPFTRESWCSPGS